MNLILYSKIYLGGLAILLGAIIINILINLLKLLSWYDFLKLISSESLGTALKSLSVLNLAFLFLVYPFLLGLIAYLFFKFL